MMIDRKNRKSVNINKYLIYGSAEFSSVLKDILEQTEKEFVGFIDDFFPRNRGVLGAFEDIISNYTPDKYNIVIGIGYKYMKERWSIYEKVRNAGYRTPSIIHPSACVRSHENIGDGAIVMTGSIVDINTTVGDSSVVWPGAVLSHDSHIGENCFISPNVTICGFVNVGRNTFIGAGSIIVDHNSVPANSFIKAGSLYCNKQRSK